MFQFLKFSKIYIVLVLLFFFFVSKTNATNLQAFSPSDSSKLKISGQWFLAYQQDESGDKTTNQFKLKRGYITFKQKLNDRFSVRFTQDITLDEEGEDAGNVELRLKYCYLNINFDDLGIIQKPQLEVGLVHRPWIDFEQKINTYKVQGSMFLERYKVVGSADFGLTFSGLLGGELPKKYQKEVSSASPGKYGSIVLGLYNGSGYHAIEQNKNKTFEGRFTFRPLPEYIPGFQISYTNVIGKGNTIESPDFFLNGFFVSSESKHHVATAQYYTGKGDFMSRYSDGNGTSFTNNGYSLFGELKTLQSKLCLFGRYDYFHSDQEIDIEKERYILGVSSYFFKKNKLIFDLDLGKNNMTNEVDRIYEVAIEILF